MADAVLAVGAVLLVADSFLPWQRWCCGIARNAWQGNGELAGGVMAGLALALLATELIGLAGATLPPPLPHDYLLDAFVAGAAAFGLLKFALVAGRHPGVGAWVGLALAAMVAAAGAWRVRSRRPRRAGPVRS